MIFYRCNIKIKQNTLWFQYLPLSFYKCLQLKIQFRISNSELCNLLNCCASRGVLIQRKSEWDAHMLWNLNDDPWEKRIPNLAKHQDLALNYCNCQVPKKSNSCPGPCIQEWGCSSAIKCFGQAQVRNNFSKSN